MTTLVRAADADFAWMLDGQGSHPAHAWTLPPGEREPREVLEWLRGLAATLHESHDRGSWLMLAGEEVVGLCSYKHPPDADGDVEIGYGVAASRRRLGHATRAVAALLVEAAGDPKVRRVTAQTSVDNPGSQRVVERNGFAQTGEAWSDEDGALLLWAWSPPSDSSAHRSQSRHAPPIRR